MQGIIILLLANFKKRKLQSILIGMIIALAAIMFTTAISISTSVKKPFERMYNSLNASQVQIANMDGVFDTETITKWWEKAEGVTVQTFYYHYSADRIVHKGEEISDGEIFFTERPDKVLDQDKLTIINGEKKNCPSAGEVWVCISFADKYRIKVGDFLEVSARNGIKKMRVSAIVADPQFGSPSMGPVRVWVAPKELRKMFDNNMSNGSFIGIRFNDYSKRDLLWSQFEDFLGRPYNGSIFDYELISSTYLMQYQILGAILIIFSFVLILIAVFIMALTISAAIVSDVKIIGILKAQGYTPFAVTALYASQYVVLSILAAACGVFLSTFIVNKVTEMLTRSMGIASMDILLFIPSITACGVIVFIVSIVSFLCAKKAGNLKPISAIKEEFIEIGNVKFINFKRISKLPTSAFIAIRQIFTQRGQSLLVFCGFVALSAVLTFSIYLINTFDGSNVFKKADEWGFDKRYDTIVFKENASINFRRHMFNVVEADKRIKYVLPVQDVGIPTRIEPQNGKLAKNVTLSAYDGDMSAIGEKNLKGRNPSSDNEVSININVSREYGKSIGEYITVSILGRKMDLRITGIYQGVFHMGWNLRTQASVVRLAMPEYRIYRYGLIYKNNNYRESFLKEYSEKYKDKIDIQPFKNTINGYMYGINEGINSFVILLSCIFAIVMLIIIFNSTFVNIYREKRIYGMYKSIGMTPTQVRMIIVWRVLFLTAAGSIIGALISCFGANTMMELFATGVGIVKFPGVQTLEGILAVIPMCLFIGFISSWVPSRNIHNISPRTLIME